MPFPLAAIGYGSIVGLSLGLTGSGGSILAIPLLVYGLGMPLSQAIVVSLLMVATIALFGAARQSFSKNVDWRAAILFSLSGVIVSPIVIQLAYDVDDKLRLLLFAGLMLIVAFRMGFGRPQIPSGHAPSQARSLSGAIKIIGGGAVAGALSGFFGVGGGFVIVPLLTMIFNMPYRVAVGTSLASISLISIAAVSGAFMKGITVDWSLFAGFVAGGALGMLAGSAFVNKIPDHLAKMIFAAVISALGIFMLIEKLYLNQGAL
jgi:uncharacterized membrane protein YfcA